jgi:hypothetical protein
MAGETYVKIATIDVGAGGASNITFSAIPSTYTDLMVLFSVVNDRNAWDSAAAVTVNGSGSSYSGRIMYGDGSSAAAMNNVGTAYCWVNIDGRNTANSFSGGSIYIPNYTSSLNKAITIDSVGESNSINSYQNLGAYTWAQTAAITSITLTGIYSTTWLQNSTATLYGILKGSGGATASSA